MSLAFSTPVLPTIAAQFEFGIAQTGLYLGKAAYLLKILGRRQLGWNSNSVLGALKKSKPRASIHGTLN